MTTLNDQLKHIVRNFYKLKVLVVGDAMLDTYIKGTPERICREAPVPVFNVRNYEFQCGGAANTAINVAALGAQTFLLSVVGRDTDATALLHELKHHKVNVSCILKDKGRVTITKKRITASSTILLRLDEGSIETIAGDVEHVMMEKLHVLFPEVDAVILSDYGYGVITDAVINAVAELNKKYKLPLIVDAKDLRRFHSLNATGVKPNYEEAATLLNIEKLTKGREAQIMAQSERLFELTNAEMVAVTLDVEGVLLFERERSIYKIACVPHDSKNTIGAGDTFISAWTLGLATGTSSNLALEIAAAAASVVVEREGTICCSNEELKVRFNSNPKVVSKEEIAAIVTRLKQRKRKIVFTNGCFDLLHRGHIDLLKKARDAGDVLIVGVNSDKSIHQLKGSGRPINSLEDRLTVLSDLSSVDYLVPFEETRPTRIIQAVKPDVFVKGATYTEQSIPEAKVLKGLQCELRIIPIEEQHPTTQLINRIRTIHDEQKVTTEL